MPTSTVISGASGNDTLYAAKSGSSSVYGNAGNDLLLGSGKSYLYGGSGNDRYAVTGPGDIVVEKAGEGIDLVSSSIDYTLGANVENLTLVDLAVKGTGNELANTIIGNAQANLLDGGLGDDRLEGRDGNDTITGGGGNDVIYGGNGHDLLYDGNDFLYGEAGDDVIYGGIGADTLRGGAGNDTLYGEDGNDTLLGEDGNDTVIGGAGDDVLYGGLGDDVLKGGDGNDTLYGGPGRDQLWGGAGKDTFAFGQDTVGVKTVAEINDFEVGKDMIHFGGIDARSGTPANDRFTFIGSAGFSHKAGELQAISQADGVHVEMDVNGDGMSDLSIIVHNVAALTANSFVL